MIDRLPVLRLLLEVTLLTKPFSLFPSVFCCLASLHKVISQHKTSWHLTDCVCSVCLLITETLGRVLFILRPSYWKTKEIIQQLFPLMNLTPQWLAVSSGPLSRIHLVCLRSGLPCWDNTVRPLLGDSHVSVVCWNSVAWSTVSIYRTEMDWIGYSEGVWVGFCSGPFGPPPSDVATVYSRWHIIWKEFWGGSCRGRSRSVWNSGTGEDVWVAGG